MVMKKNWKNRSGVSPVIATILMVAITVVLAAVLYVMVMGFGTSSSAPTAVLKATNASTASVKYQEKVMVTSISTATDYANVKVSLMVGGTNYVATMAKGDSGVTISYTGTALPATAATITFIDLANDGKVSTGDYFTVQDKATNGGTAFTLSLLYGNDASSIASDSWTSA